jgi:hypothetical protein
VARVQGVAVKQGRVTEFQTVADAFQMLGLTAAIIVVRRTIALGLGYAARATA